MFLNHSHAYKDMFIQKFVLCCLEKSRSYTWVEKYDVHQVVIIMDFQKSNSHKFDVLSKISKTMNSFTNGFMQIWSRCGGLMGPLFASIENLVMVMEFGLLNKYVFFLSNFDYNSLLHRCLL